MSESQMGGRVAALQMVSGADIEANLQEAERLLTGAARSGVQVAVLPENFAVLNTEQMIEQGRREAEGKGEIRAFLAGQAAKLGMWIVGGSLPLALRHDDQNIPDRVRATCLVYDNKGTDVARYDKVHLFDATVEDAQGQYRESDTFEPGSEIVAIDTPIGKLGLCICYDLRFPELFRALRAEKVDWISVPSAFTYHTGEAHWHTLMRARAIENQVWMVGAGQGGQHNERRRTYGHSMVVDPWGRISAEMGEGPGIVTADLDGELLNEVRTRMPVWSHRRL